MLVVVVRHASLVTPVTSLMQSPQFEAPRARSRADALIKSHINALPLEIFGTIFILSLSSDKKIDGRPIWRDPLPFCAVSSLWRSVALATPQLWQHVRVPRCMFRMTDKSKAQELVLWIERSGTLPLTLFIPHVSLSRAETVDPIVELLDCYASRWETVCFQDYSFLNLLEFFRPEKWSSLRRMHGARSCDIINQWAQLTHLHICDRVHSSQAMGIFKGCLRLVWLSLNIYGESPAVPTPPIVIYDLSFLSLSATNLSAIIQSISLPSLREICVRNTAPSFINPGLLKSFPHLLTRSACTLDKLCMRSVPPRPNDLIQILAHRSCNSLTSLTISQWSAVDESLLISNGVLRRLTLGRDDSVCTHLKYLSLASYTSLAALPNMVESRICSDSGQLSEVLLEELEVVLDNFDHGQKLHKIVEKSGMEYRFGVAHPERGARTKYLTVSRRVIL